MKPTSKELLDRYFAAIKGSKLWPPLNNYSLFTFGSEYNSKRYFSSEVYDDPGSYNLLMISDGVNSGTYIPEERVFHFAVEVFGKYLKDQSAVKYIEKRLYENFIETDTLYAENTYKVIADKTEKELCVIVDKMISNLWHANAWAHFSIYFDKDLCARLIKENNYPLSEEQLSIIWDKAITPAFLSFDKAQEKFALSLLAQGKKLEDIAEDCQYFFTNYREAQPISDVQKQLIIQYGHIKGPDQAKEVLDVLIQEEKHNLALHEAWLKELSKEERVIAEYCQTVMRVRDSRKNFFAKGLATTWRISEKMFVDAGIDPKFVRYVLIFQELMKGVEFLKTKREEIEKRQFGYVALMPYEGGVEIAYDNVKEVSEELNGWYIKSENAQTNEIKGQVGSKGKVKGVVKIVLDANRAEHFNEGDILVAGMTRPEYVPLMKKASAIVTDEGGITCHAAIVSRELGLPCVIGTKIATRVLKDGDMIEVDANTGVVKILSK